jgi:hypothetical protein
MQSVDPRALPMILSLLQIALYSSREANLDACSVAITTAIDRVKTEMVAHGMEVRD